MKSSRTLEVPKFENDPTYMTLYMYLLTGLVPFTTDGDGVEICVDAQALRIPCPRTNTCWWLEIADGKVVAEYSKSELCWRHV